MERLKVYGERNTNTNYLRRLIELNLQVELLPGIAPRLVRRIQTLFPGKELVKDVYFAFASMRHLGWKHARPSLTEVVGHDLWGSVGFITLTKNPYSWLLSLYRRPYHQYYRKRPSFETFLQTPWKNVRRARVGRMLDSPIDLWNIKNRSYLLLPQAYVVNAKTEATFIDAEGVIERIARRFGIPRKTDRFVDYERSTKSEDKDGAWYRAYYLEERWREELSDEAVRIINRSIDRELMSRFGYEVLSPMPRARR